MHEKKPVAAGSTIQNILAAARFLLQNCNKELISGLAAGSPAPRNPGFSHHCRLVYIFGVSNAAIIYTFSTNTQ